MFNRLRDWLYPKKVDPQPAPVPAPAPAPKPEPPVITPSNIQLVNYIRALAILRGIPFQQLRTEFFKLPLRKIGWVLGVTFWLYMTYAIVGALFGMLR
jgi:hypothetical protein